MGHCMVHVSTRCWRGEQKYAAGTGVLILRNMSVETISNI